MRRESKETQDSQSGMCAKTVWVGRDMQEVRSRTTEVQQIFKKVRELGEDGDDETSMPHPLEDITDLELEEIRQLKHPPEPVRRVMECVHLILYEVTPPSDRITWHTVVRAVVQTSFLRRVRRYELEELAQKPQIVHHLCKEYFNRSCAEMRLERVRRASKAVVAFFGWTVALLAGVFPRWEVEEVGDQESREVIAELEAERRVFVKQESVRKEEERLQQERKDEDKREARRRLEEQKQAVLLEKQKQAQEVEERAAQEEAAKQAQEEAQRRAEEERLLEEERKREMVKEQKRAAKLRREQLYREMEAAQYRELCVWNTVNNPDRRLLQVEGSTVSFPSDANANYCNVLTCEALEEGIIYYEFIMHQLGDEQWCGVTLDPAQGGMRISGWNLRAWTYYCGRRWEHPQAFHEGIPGLHDHKKVLKQFARVSSGDTIGMLVDATRRGVVFLRNDEVQGGCPLDATSKPLYVICHLDCGGDCVELRAKSPTEAPEGALKALETVVCLTEAAE